MYYRCPNCSATAYVNIAALEVESKLRCAGCGDAHDAYKVDELGHAEQARSRVLSLARACDLDNETALTVLLGILPLARARRAEASRKTGQTAGPDHAAAPRRTVSTSSLVWAVGGLSTAALVLVLWQPLGLGAEPRQSAPVLPHAQVARSVEVTRDDRGAILSVSGPDPGWVLWRFCDAAPPPLRYEPEQIVLLPGREGRLGVFRDLDSDRELAIEIRRADGRAQHWVTGDGSRRILPMEAPPIPLGTPTIPVTR